MLRYLCWFYYNVVAELGEEKAKDVPGNTVNFKNGFLAQLAILLW